MGYLLVTNDFPPKLGGIQSYLYELFRRLPPKELTVLTTAHRGSAAFDQQQSFRIERWSSPVLLPTPRLARVVRQLSQSGGCLSRALGPGAARGPHREQARGSLRRRAARGRGDGPGTPARRRVSSCDRCSPEPPSPSPPAATPGPRPRAPPAPRTPPMVVVPPGVDHVRFHPLAPEEKVAVRRRLGLPTDGRLVVSVSRLVPRKGMDVLIEAVGALSAERGDLTLAIGGAGRDRGRLELKARRSAARVRLLGRVSDADLPLLDGAADVWAMCCRDRWFGLEREGFGIVFLEAAATGVAQLAGRSGGSDEAVVDGQTGLVVDRPRDSAAVAASLARLLDDVELRDRLGAQARRRALSEFDYDMLARRLHEALVHVSA